MVKRWLEISVGGLLVAGVVALLIIALQVSGTKLQESSSSYRINALFGNAGGLSHNARVTVAGVTMGSVESISIDPVTLMAKVVMSIDSKVDYLSIDSSASILTSGLLGEKYIGLSIGAEDDVLVDGDIIVDTQSAIVLEELIGKVMLSIGGQ